MSIASKSLNHDSSNQGSPSHGSPNNGSLQISPNRALQNQTFTKKRVLVVDDHPIVRQGLALLINREPDLVVCGEADEATGAMHVLTSAKPDVLLVDISLNGPDGLERMSGPLVPPCRC
jgi:PleD family two-component response regulator